MKYSYDRSPFVPKFSREFFSRRIQSFAGFLFLIFLIEHLLTNSQAALFFDEGKHFIDMVNFIHSLPYLPVIELSAIALPVAVHAWWGIERLFTAKFNSIHSDGSIPVLKYPRNRAYTWQRITSVLLIFAVGLHVWYMRFHAAPVGERNGYYVVISDDPDLTSIAQRLNVTLNKKDGQVTAIAESEGAAMWMMVRDTYKSILVCLAYSVFVVMASFHSCNGLWTLLITWGITLSERSRQLMRVMCNTLMTLLILFGFFCIWGVYWINWRW